MSNTTLFLIAIVIIMLAGVPVAMMLKDFLPNIMEKSGGLEQIENRVYVLHAEAQELQNRVNHLVQRRNSQFSDRNRLESDIRKAEKLIRDLADQPPMFVHEVGDPQAGLMKFVATVTQEKASAAARAAGERAQVNPIWRCTNVAEVWASSFDEAKQMCDVAFPFKLGFQKSFMRGDAKAGGKGGGGKGVPTPPATARAKAGAAT
ncbi:hypothetical protein TSH100_24845 [Azospirillum sp. TSH100]|uniref:hypothetical protein n=1 Tax=Azospirillum sp. TSH100 TaxID=652764 RepID=UPI000D60B38F|nr:hypothetical protein [Azospirillum sp. TSH100]PWC81978.1 hypothetical protein TSH100_24845 [Azospirillum sp. TSH100]QCG88129.1 hypothetical protein E6C72_10630 [Azospirillum sp. TSH100]